MSAEQLNLKAEISDMQWKASNKLGETAMNSIGFDEILDDFLKNENEK